MKKIKNAALANQRAHAQRVAELCKKRKEILALPSEKALDRILEAPQPAALVHSFPEEDFYFLVQDIGPEDSLPLLSLASNKQWEYILDLETWEKDRIANDAVTRWLSLLLRADSKRLMKWFLEEKKEVIEFYLFKNLEIRLREHDQDPSDFPEDFMTYDQTIYFRIIDFPGAEEDTEIMQAQRQEFLMRLTERLAALDYAAFHNILLEAAAVIPAEMEEEAYRQRNVRLAEKGFLPFDEAVGVYQSLKPEDLKRQRTKSILTFDENLALLPVPLYAVGLMQEDNHFTRALKMIDTDRVLQQLQTEFASLCNQIIVADHKTPRNKEELRAIVKKACGYLGIGLEELAQDEKGGGPQRPAALITQYPLSQIFRVGFGRALKLKWRAEKWLARCWFAQAGLRLTFWGENWLGVLGGLLIKKPLFYDNYASGVLYREFATLDDIRVTEEAFNRIKALDDLLSLMPTEPETLNSLGFLTYKSLILTRWARHHLGLPGTPFQALTLEQFRVLFADLFETPSDAGRHEPRRVPLPIKESFLNWLATETGLKDYEISEQIGPAFEDLFDEIEAEYGRVAVQDLDPRYIHLFLIVPGKK
ncbi:MAG: hypothetical protein JSW39_13105 [Desulfobacterales bacterium]|nr:MAG: hypothetical protein JSW39_13105 [Desulfobacterales bacterium]